MTNSMVITQIYQPVLCFHCKILAIIDFCFQKNVSQNVKPITGGARGAPPGGHVIQASDDDDEDDDDDDDEEESSDDDDGKGEKNQEGYLFSLLP